VDRSKFHILEDGCQAFGVTLTDKQIEQFEKYYELLVEWNKVMNLTGITEFDEVMQKHFVDSAAAAKYVEMEKVNSLIDVGTGAGFPGIPLKIVYPHIQVTLLDSLNKRIKFLEEVVDNLGLTGIETVHGRAEDAAKKAEYREQFDLSVSRAVANLASLTEYCLPFVKVGGKFVSYKSVSVDEEITQSKKAVYVLGGEIGKVEKFNLPESDMERALVIVEKKRSTPKKYPRKAGMPTKEPLV
jgi:16S rRNA (guanine527-N7)-methyltransferase